MKHERHRASLRRSAKHLIVTLALLAAVSTAAAGEAMSITLKPSSGLAGLTAFNLHSDGRVTVLVYESASKITETTVEIESGALTQIRDLAKGVLEEFMKLDSHAAVPLYRQSLGVAITRDDVTRSVTTRRFTESALSLIESLKLYVPAMQPVALERVN